MQLSPTHLTIWSTECLSAFRLEPERVADKILTGVRKNRFLIYTSNDIRALYLFKRTMWWPYSIAMREANDVFTRLMPRTR